MLKVERKKASSRNRQKKNVEILGGVFWFFATMRRLFRFALILWRVGVKNEKLELLSAIVIADTGRSL